MYSIIILQEFRSALMRDTFLNRNNIVIRAAGSNDELLQLHCTDPAGLIVTRIDAQGMSGEQLCMSIREDKALRNVSVIMVCPDTGEGRAAAERCRAN
jgi:DNA-binding response OmpR family regulator